MRIALITLALTALLFIGSIVYSFLDKDGNISIRTASVQSTRSLDSAMDIEVIKNQIKTEEKLNKIMEKVETLAQGQWTIDISRNASNQQKNSTGRILPLSWKFLAQVMPELDFSLIQNNWIYELLIFENVLEYSTYLDGKQWIKAQPLSIKYDIFLKNMTAISSDVFTVNETKTFPFRSFFVNPKIPDTLVRLVIETESQCIVLEIPKTRYEAFKKLLLKK